VAKILTFEFIDEKHLWTVEIKKIDENIVAVVTTFERLLKNTSSKNRPCCGLYNIEELNFPNRSSDILECEVEDEDNKDNIQKFEGFKKGNHNIEAKTEPITVKPNHKAKVRGKAIQYRRINDTIYETFMFPAVDPQIEVTISDEFEHMVEFGTRGDVEKSKYRNIYTLSGVYFPGQYMRVRWWPKELATTPLK